MYYFSLTRNIFRDFIDITMAKQGKKGSFVDGIHSGTHLRVAKTEFWLNNFVNMPKN